MSYYETKKWMTLNVFSEIMKVRWQQNTFKVLKTNKKLAERIYEQHPFTKINAEEKRFFRLKGNVTTWNLDVHKGMKRTRNEMYTYT